MSLIKYDNEDRAAYEAWVARFEPLLRHISNKAYVAGTPESEWAERWIKVIRYEKTRAILLDSGHSESEIAALLE